MHQITEYQNADQNISCPCCNQYVLDWTQEQYIQPCEHTVFIALDLGFEYISDSFECFLPVSVDEIHHQELNVWENIKQVKQDLIVYKLPLGVAYYSRYIGFKKG